MLFSFVRPGLPGFRSRSQLSVSGPSPGRGNASSNQRVGGLHPGDQTDCLAFRPPGQFTVFRLGNTNENIQVYYNIGGTASNGVDYAQISPIVSIPAGALSGTITITPLNSNSVARVETVDLTLAPSPLASPVNYIIGCPNNATVFIAGVGVTNVPPFVALTSPVEGEVFTAPANIPLVAVAGDCVDGSVTSVEFFAGTNSLGVLTNWVVVDPLPPEIAPPCPPPGSRAFILDWTNVPPGSYSLTAVASDNNGLSSISKPVDILVQKGSSQIVVPS